MREAKALIESVELRLKRTKKGVTEEARSTLQQKLIGLRHAIEDRKTDEIKSLVVSVETFVEEQLAPHEKGAFREWFESIGIAIILALFLRGFIVEAFKIPSGSMIPTLLIGDHLFVNKFVYGIRVPFTERFVVNFGEPERGEVVVFSFPRKLAKKHLESQPIAMRGCIDQESLATDKAMIKRVVAVAGDTVELRQNQLVVNGKPVKRTFLRKEATGNYMFPHEILETEAVSPDKKYTIQYSRSGSRFGPVKVPEGFIFAMGDNRDRSSDSRCWGPVPLDNLKGRAMFIWLSIDTENLHWTEFWKYVRWERFGQSIE
jgi:signal peptidase I